MHELNKSNIHSIEYITDTWYYSVTFIQFMFSNYKGCNKRSPVHVQILSDALAVIDLIPFSVRSCKRFHHLFRAMWNE